MSQLIFQFQHRDQIKIEFNSEADLTASRPTLGEVFLFEKENKEFIVSKVTMSKIIQPTHPMVRPAGFELETIIYVDLKEVGE